jgi:hypothetical protein
LQQESVYIADDVGVTDAINDWDTTRWSQETVEAAFSTLLQECYAGDDEITVSANKTAAKRRRLLARGMLLKLTRCHACAAKKLERSLEVLLSCIVYWSLASRSDLNLTLIPGVLKTLSH